MLTGLSIRNVVLIEALDLAFDAGLTVLTGETGAGKSILLDALGLALGARADSGLVRSGADQASVTATFDAPAKGSALATILSDNEIDQEPGEPLLIRRTLKADGGSRAYLNDQPCSAALLRDVGALLVEIHGQHDERGLLNPRGHMALLDAFGGLDTAAVAGAHAARHQAEKQLSEARETLPHAPPQRDYLAPARAQPARFAPAGSGARGPRMVGPGSTGCWADRTGRSRGGVRPPAGSIGLRPSMIISPMPLRLSIAP